MRRLFAAVAMAAVLLGGCSDGGEGSGAASPSEDDRRFCDLVEEAPPTADPFESGIGPGEVERRLDSLRQRFDALSAVAPGGLAGDLEELERALGGLDEVLAAEDYDLAALAESDPDLSRFDDPRFEEIGARLADHRAEVCGT